VSLDLSALSTTKASDLLTALESAAVGGATPDASTTVVVVVSLVTAIDVTVPDGKTVDEVAAALSKTICGDPASAGCTVVASTTRRLRIQDFPTGSRRGLSSTSFKATQAVNTSSTASIPAPTVDDSTLATELGIGSITSSVGTSAVEAEVTVTKEGSASSDVASSTVDTMSDMGSTLASDLSIDQSAITTVSAPTVIAPPDPPPPPSPSPLAPSPSPPASAAVQVVVELIAAGEVSDVSDADKSAIASAIADAASVPASAVAIAITSASIKITATISYASAAARNAGKQGLEAALRTAETATAMLAAAGIRVTSAPMQTPS
jgi:hypothetical protein